MSLNDLAASSSVSAPQPGVQRPLGLTLLSIALAWLALQLVRGALSFERGYPLGEAFGLRVMVLASGVSAAVACVGLWKVRRWGYQAFLAWAGVTVAGGLYSSATDASASSSDRLIGLGLAAAVLVPLALYVRRRTAQVQASQYVKRTPYQAGKLEVIIGVMLLIPSVYFLRWLVTSPDAGYLMIFGAMLGLGALLASVVGVTLMIGGLWTAYELPGRRWAHVVPLVAGIGVAGYLLSQL